MAQLIQDLTLLLLVSLPINILFHRVQLPSVMGYLLAGIVIGPHGLGLIGQTESVDHLAEIGIILLLFIIGMEFSLNHLLKNLTRVLGTGGLQLVLITGPLFFIGPALGFSYKQSIVLGLLSALSSTAIVLKMVTDRAEIDTLHGRVSIGVLLFQDVCVVPLMLIIPLLSGGQDISGLDFSLALLKSIGAIVGVFLLSRMLVPRILEVIAKSGNKEHMTLFVILMILGTGWVSQKLGLTLGMGAFIAGMILSESEYQHQINLDILPVKDYFGSIFFISIGMLLQTQMVWEKLGLYLGLTLGLIVLKASMTFLSAVLIKNPIRISFIVGLRLAQIGEFSLILAGLALGHGLWTGAQYQGFLTVSLLSMLMAPLLIQASTPLSLKLFSKTTPQAGEDSIKQEAQLTDHVIIAGYGLVGRNLSRVLHEIHIPFVVVELDGEKIKYALRHGAQVLYGDSTHRDTLIRANATQARILVVSIPDHDATEQVVRLSRLLNPDLYILVRTRFDTQVDSLMSAGANLVIPEEFETSIEVFSRVLREFKIPNNVIEQQVELVRMEGYGMFRGFSLNAESLRKFSTYLTATLTESFQVHNEGWCFGHTVGQLKLKSTSGARLIAVVRKQEVFPNPADDYQLEDGDILILFGRHVQLDRAIKLLEAGPQATQPPKNS